MRNLAACNVRHQEVPQFADKLGIRTEFMFNLTKSQREPRYPCPVCGFPLKYPPEDFNICPSCGVEFGYETAGRSFYELRQEWVDSGAHWASRVHDKPRNWNPWIQLETAHLSYFRPEFHNHPSSMAGARAEANITFHLPVLKVLVTR